MLLSRHFASQQTARQTPPITLSLSERLQQGALPLVLLCVLAFSYLLARYLEEDAVPPPEDTKQHLPVHTMRDLWTASLNADGHLIVQLQALEGAFYPNKEVELTEPYLVIYHQDRPVWYVRAPQAWGSAEGDKIILLGETQIWRYLPTGELELHIVTQDVLIRPHEQYAETAAPVTVTTPQGHISSVGMRAYMVLEQLELLANVKAYYESYIEIY